MSRRLLLAVLLALLVSLACGPLEREPTPNGLAAGEVATTAGGGAADPPAVDPPPAPPPALPPATAGPPAAGELAERSLDYLERARHQLARLERGIGQIGPEREATLALTTAALATRGRADAAEAVSDAEEALAACRAGWRGAGCERAIPPLQRLVLQFPEVLPEEVRQRLRASLAQPPPPPPPGQVGDAWGFRQTENQRLVTLASALGAHALAGSGDSPAGRAWADHAAALLVARDELGWYEEESAGYLGISLEALLHLRDFAPDARVRQLAERQLDLLFARFAERQVGGVPAGARTRTYIHWALGRKNLPWPAWAWYAGGVGDPEGIAFGDWPVLALSGYRVPEPVRRLLAGRRTLGTYEVRQRRVVDPGHRKAVDAAIYSYATPDYILSASQAVAGRELTISGGQEVGVVLLAEGPEFSPLYLWSRVDLERKNRWRVRGDQERAVAARNVALARLGTPEEPGHAYLAPPWQAPEVVGEAVVSRSGDTYVALVTAGGWEVAAAAERFAAVYGRDRAYRGAHVAVPKRQPAAVALVVGRAAEAGPFAAWKERAGRLRLAVERGGGPGAGEPVRLAFAPGEGLPAVAFVPGRSATVDGAPLAVDGWPVHASPFLTHERGGGWLFRLGEVRAELAPLVAPPAAAPATDGS